MRKLHLDIETYSSESIDNGVYKYASSPDFDILLIAYAWDDGPVQILDMPKKQYMLKEGMWLVDALLDSSILKVAHNATFERVCFTMWLHKMHVMRETVWLDAMQWHCTMIQCSRCGLPLSLAQAGKALGLEQQKMSEGKALIKLFCQPKVKKGGGLFQESERNSPEDFPDKWQTFKDYCIRDVEVERQIDKATSWYPVSDFERQLYAIDQRINDRGVLLDMELVRNAVRADLLQTALLNEEAMKITGLSNPNSVPQLKGWLREMTGLDLDTLNKKDVADLKGTIEDVRVLRVLQIRSEMGKSSNKKYHAMLDVAGDDDRARGLMQFYGSRTGRWAGRLVQVQNLPQNHITDIDFARTCLKENDIEMIELGYGNVPDILSQLIRTAFIAPEGRTLAVCDFSAIEARVLAWMAGEEWVLDVFRKGGDIYCATASQMFHKPVEKHGQNAELRQKGKIAVLALGYGGGVHALDTMGGKRMGMTEQEEKDTVAKWREANPHITSFWRNIEQAVRNTLVTKESYRVGSLLFYMHGDSLCCCLPSGRSLCYPKMEIHFDQDWAYIDQTDAQAATSPAYIVKEKKSKHLDKYAADGRLRYKGLNQVTNRWEWVDVYGGKLTENIIQAVARDCLAHSMTLIEKAGIRIVFHVHDEVVCEVPSPDYLSRIKYCFDHGPEWAEGLPLSGAGYVTPYYLKD